MVSKNDRLRERYLDVKRHRHWHTWPLVRQWRAMQFRAMQPLGRGKAAGLSIIRYYWADFLEQHRADIRGRALEVEETTILWQYGGDAVTQADAIDLAAHHAEVKVVADLSRADAVAGEQYDCFVLPFSTAVIFDIEAALYHAVRLLKPGGVLLANFWCMDFYFHDGLDMGTGASLYMHHWFTPIQVNDLLHRVGLVADDYEVQVYGNLMARLAFLLNLPARDLTSHERDHVDPGQPLMIGVRVRRPVDWRAPAPLPRELQWTPQAAPSIMRADTRQYGDQYRNAKASK